MHVQRSATVLVSLALGLIFPTLETTAQTLIDSQSERAKLELFRLTGIPPRELTIVSEAALANTGITRFKIRDSHGNVHGISLDVAGNPVNPEILGQTVQAIDDRVYLGKLEAKLAVLLNQGTDSPIRVMIRLNQETDVPPLRPQTREQQQAHLVNRRSRYAAIQQPLVNLLKANGQQVIYQPSYTAVVGADVTPSVLRRIAERPDVERISLEHVCTPKADEAQAAFPANTENGRDLPESGAMGAVNANRVGTYPPQLLKVFPPEESTQTFVQSICADFNFKLAGGADAASLQLLVDGVDVTKQSTIAGTRDWPPSSLSISYNPVFSQPGTHCAELRFQTLKGKPTSYDWCFSVASVTPRPPQIQSVSPPEELTQTEVRYVGADFDFQLGEGVNPSSMQLFLDGVDVTSQSEIGSTRNGCFRATPTCPPPSSGGIFYTPNRLEPGTHQAEIRFQTLNGTPQSYKWSFSVESPSPSR